MPELWIVLAGQVLLGVGFTFVSRAFVAWVTDEIGEEAARPLYLRAAQARQLASILGLVAAAIVWARRAVAAGRAGRDRLLRRWPAGWR